MEKLWIHYIQTTLDILVYTRIWTVEGKIVHLSADKRKDSQMLSQGQIDIIIQSMLPYNPVRIGIFGSVARGEDSPKSDIDILYRFKNAVGLFNLVRMKDDMEKN